MFLVLSQHQSDIGVSLNTSKLNEKEAQKIINETKEITGLPVTDPVRFGSGKMSSNRP